MSKTTEHSKASVIAMIFMMATSIHAATTINSYDSLYRLTRVDYDNGTSIAYTYDAAGNRLTLVSQDPAIRIISLSGDLNFGSVPVGSSAQRILTIANSGTRSLAVTRIDYPSGFSGNWSSGTIAAGGSREVTVTFTPTAAQSYSETITVNSDKTSGVNTIAASGTGVGSSGPVVLFQDDFNDNSFDSSKWGSYGSTVTESGQMMQVLTTVTDQPGTLTNIPFSVSNTGVITITRRVFLHYANSYFQGRFTIHIGSLPAFAVHYQNYDWSATDWLAKHGFFISRNGASPNNAAQQNDISADIPAIWDTWFNEKIIYNPSSGQLDYFINDSLKTTFNVGVLPAAQNPLMNLEFQAYGWWTGHQQLFDDFVVSQVAGTPANALSVTPPSQSVEFTAGTRTFAITNIGDGTMAYTASEASSWLSIKSGGTGGNSGTVTVSYAANPTTTARTGTVTVTASGISGSPKSVTVEQEGAPALNVAPASQPVDSMAGVTTFVVTNTNVGTMLYTTSESVSWLSIASGGAGTNNGTITILYDANPTTTARTGTITVTASGAVGSPRSLKVVQAGMPALTVAPTSTNVFNKASNGRTIKVTANMSWTAVSNASWIAVTAGHSGTNNGTVTFSVLTNAGITSRTGGIVVAGGGLNRTCTVVQAGTAALLTIKPTSTNVQPIATSGHQIEVTANVPWVATQGGTNDMWIDIVSGTPWTGSGTLTYSVTNNPGSKARSGTIVVSGGGFARTCTVVQARNKFAVDRMLNCGGAAVNEWEADEGWSTSTDGGAASSTVVIANAVEAPQAVYQTRRYGSTVTYNLAIPDGRYTVRLHFAELYWTAAGKRRFNVFIEGQAVLNNFDIWTAAGGINRAVTQTFEDVEVSGGLQIQAVGTTGTAQFNGIEVWMAGPPVPQVVVNSAAVSVPEGGTATFGVKLNVAPAGAVTVAVVRASGDADLLVTGGSALIFTAGNYGTEQVVTLSAAEDADSANGTASIQCSAPGHISATVTATEQDDETPAVDLKINSGGNASGAWVADTNWTVSAGGGAATSTAAIANIGSVPAAVYQTRRYGSNVTYNLAVPNGTYDIRLHFAELAYTAAGQRRFHVSLEGGQVLTNFDIVAAAGGKDRAVVRAFSNVVVSGGLQIVGVGTTGTAQFNGLEVVTAGSGGRRRAPVRAVHATAGMWPVAAARSGAAEWTAAPALADGNLDTVWTGAAGAGIWAAAIDFEDCLPLLGVDIRFAGPPRAAGILGSSDQETWYDLGLVTNWPVPCRALYFQFPEDGTGAPPAIREILWEEGAP